TCRCPRPRRGDRSRNGCGRGRATRPACGPGRLGSASGAPRSRPVADRTRTPAAEAARLAARSCTPGGSAVVHLLHSVDYGATALVLVALGLIARRDDFDVRGDRERTAHLARRALLLGIGLYGYGAAALWANRLMA